MFFLESQITVLLPLLPGPSVSFSVIYHPMKAPIATYVGHIYLKMMLESLAKTD